MSDEEATFVARDSGDEVTVYFTEDGVVFLASNRLRECGALLPIEDAARLRDWLTEHLPAVD